MKISNIAKAILLPTLMLPLAGSNAKAADEKKDRTIPAANRVFSEMDAPAIATLALPRSTDPMSLALLGLSRKLDRKHHISEVIVNEERFDESAIGKIDTYYKIDTENTGRFYIARNKNAKPDTMFDIAYDKEDRENGKLFLPAIDEETPVATIPGKEAGLPGVFKVYEKNGAYEISYNFHPMIWVPDHSNVSATYLVHLENAIRKLPRELTKELYNKDIYVLTGADYKDVYYRFYPQWENEDNFKPWDPKKPVYEIKKDSTWIDRRRYMHIGGLYIDRKAIIPQTYINYYSGKNYDYAEDKNAIIRVLYHELGHAYDYVYNSAYSDEDGFRTTHKADTKKFTDDDKDKLRYFYRSRSETFAHVTAALLGGLDKEESAVILSKFKHSAEHIRQDVFQRLKINITIEQIRKDIYPDYLKKQGEKGKIKISMLSDVIIPPDIHHDVQIAQSSNIRPITKKKEDVVA